MRTFLLAASLTLWPCIVPAQTVRITDDVGGRIGTYIEAYSALRASGQKVVIDGICLSACTLVLGIVPPERICATRKARLGFHAAWMPGPSGKPIPSEVGTQALNELYPPHIKAYIKKRGGLSSKMFFTRNGDIFTLVPPCEPVERTAKRKSAPRRSLYANAN